MPPTRPEALMLTQVGSHKNKRLTKRFPLLALSLAASFLVFATLHYEMTHAMPSHNSSQTILAASKPQNFQVYFAKAFEQENQHLPAFCDAWNAQIARGAQDPFSWIQELSPVEGLEPFSMAVPRDNHGGRIGRSLERYGFWQAELTQDVMSVLDQTSNSVFIDIGAGLGWFSFAAAAANHSVLALETEKLNVAALRRSACANEYHQSGNFILLESSGLSNKHRVSSVGEALLRVAPRIVESLASLEISTESEKVIVEEVIGSVVLVHPETAHEALEAMETIASVEWPQIFKPKFVAMVLPLEIENVDAQTTKGTEEDIASSVFHQMHALGYNIRMDSPNNMAQSPAAFASLAAKLAKGGDNERSETLKVWFTLP